MFGLPAVPAVVGGIARVALPAARTAVTGAYKAVTQSIPRAFGFGAGVGSTLSTPNTQTVISSNQPQSSISQSDSVTMPNLSRTGVSAATPSDFTEQIAAFNKALQNNAIIDGRGGRPVQDTGERLAGSGSVVSLLASIDKNIQTLAASITSASRGQGAAPREVEIGRRSSSISQDTTTDLKGLLAAAGLAVAGQAISGFAGGAANREEANAAAAQNRANLTERQQGGASPGQVMAQAQARSRNVGNEELANILETLETPEAQEDEESRTLRSRLNAQITIAGRQERQQGGGLTISPEISSYLEARRNRETARREQEQVRRLEQEPPPEEPLPNPSVTGNQARINLPTPTVPPTLPAAGNQARIVVPTPGGPRINPRGNQPQPAPQQVAPTTTPTQEQPAEVPLPNPSIPGAGAAVPTTQTRPGEEAATNHIRNVLGSRNLMNRYDEVLQHLRSVYPRGIPDSDPLIRSRINDYIARTPSSNQVSLTGQPQIPEGATPVRASGQIVGYMPTDGGPTVTFTDTGRQTLESARAQIAGATVTPPGATPSQPSSRPTGGAAATQSQLTPASRPQVSPALAAAQQRGVAASNESNSQERILREAAVRAGLISNINAPGRVTGRLEGDTAVEVTVGNRTINLYDQGMLSEEQRQRVDGARRLRRLMSGQERLSDREAAAEDDLISGLSPGAQRRAANAIDTDVAAGMVPRIEAAPSQQPTTIINNNNIVQGGGGGAPATSGTTGTPSMPAGSATPVIIGVSPTPPNSPAFFNYAN